MEVYHININKEGLDINAFVAAKNEEIAMMTFGKEAAIFGIELEFLQIEDAEIMVKLFEGLHFDTDVTKVVYANLE